MATKFPPAGFRDAQSFEVALQCWCEELEDFQLAWLAGPPTASEINTLHARFYWCRQEVPQLEEGHEGEAFEGWTERAVDLIQRFHDTVSEAVIRGSAALQFPDFNDLFDSDTGGRSDRAWRMLRALADCHMLSTNKDLATKPPKVAEPKPKRKTANVQMLDIMTENPVARTWTLREWAKLLGVRPSTIAATRAWKEAVEFQRNESETRAIRLKGRIDRRNHS